MKKNLNLVAQAQQKVMKELLNKFEITNSLTIPVTGLLVIISVIILRKPGW